MARVPEPPTFDERVRKRGQKWLAEHRGTAAPRPYWLECLPALCEGFQRRCGYTAMLDLVGTVDHFRSQRDHPELVYEWSNLRYASGWINAAKKAVAVLDPYEVGEGWFEVLLPSMQLAMTDRVPEAHRALAKATLAALPLEHDECVVRLRRCWYDEYRTGGLPLENLRHYAPLVAAAVERHLAAGAPLP